MPGLDYITGCKLFVISLGGKHKKALRYLGGYDELLQGQLFNKLTTAYG
jgi:hypothetical protein